MTIVTNDRTVVESWDVGAHTFTRDRLDVTKHLKLGGNVCSLTFAQGTTGYWLRRVELRCTFSAGTVVDGKVERVPGAASDYVVAVTRATWTDPAWRKVVDALVAKHAATVLVCPATVLEARGELGALRPRFACFVARPDELGRDVVVGLHRLTRSLDDDPYTDVRWGILTGYDAADALRIASRVEPLLVRRGAAGTGIDLSRLDSGVWFSEGEKNVCWEKAPGAAPAQRRCADDATAEIATELNAGKPDLFVTSGHATERDWQVAYSFRAGQFRCEGGRVVGLPDGGGRAPVGSPNPNGLQASGDSRKGQIPPREAMALAWMHSAGVEQMVGYAGSSLFGSTAGFATLDYFVTGGLSLSDAWFAAEQWLVHRLETRYARSAREDIENYEIEHDPQLVETLAKRHHVQEQEELVLLWDRDLFAFYGDPAWTARLASPRPPVEIAVTEQDGTFTVVATATEDGAWSREAFAWLPRRVKDPKVVRGDALVTDDFVLLPLPEKLSKGEKVEAVFTAGRP